MKRIFFCVSAALFIAVHCKAQYENDNWFFGDSCAISFTTGVPVNSPHSHMYAFEGVASISDSLGDLLFYTDGATVYNALHSSMPNGQGLNGTGTSTQAALIAKDPANAYQYYIFTTEGYSQGVGLCYSVVNINLQGGLGDVTVKNIPLVSPVNERLTGIVNSTNDGYWILTHQNNGTYYAFPLTATGVGSPVISNVGISNTALFSYIGQMKLSPDKRVIANCLLNLESVEITRFNDTTGTVSEPFIYHVSPSAQNATYGVEFSKTGHVLYVSSGVSSPERLFQLDMTSGDSTSIIASAFMVYSHVGSDASLQIGPDGKIYVAHPSRKYLGVINYPDSLGFACSYVDTGFVLDSSCERGLPNSLVIPWYNSPQAFIQSLVTKICPDSCISFGNQSVNATSYEWLFQGGTPSYSTDEFPSVCYNTSGTYDVTLIAHSGPCSDTTISSNLIQVYASPTPTVTQANDTLFVTGMAGVTYQWQYNGVDINGATNSFYVPIQNGQYSLVTTNGNDCSGFDSYEVTTIGIDDVSISSPQLFPNPADESLMIQLGYNREAELKLYNTLGQLVYADVMVNETTVDVSMLAPGVYCLSVRTSDGVSTVRLVVR